MTKKSKSIYDSGTTKGSKPRTKISPKEWGDKWEKIFRPKKKK